MAKYNLRQKAIELRLAGASYNRIRSLIGVSKSSLSLWLREYPLNKKQLADLKELNEGKVEKFRKTMLLKRVKRFSLICDTQTKEILPLSQKELLVAGIFLYWGEGGKDLKRPVSIHNSNPQIIKFALYWYTKILGVERKNIKVNLHLYSDMKISEEMEYWSGQLKIPLSQFIKPYVKESKRSKISHKGSFKHGTCGLVVNSISLKEKVMAAIKVIGDFYENKI